MTGNAAAIAETIQNMHHYGFQSFHHSNDTITLDWKFLKEARDKYVLRINDFYKNTLKNNNITSIIGSATLSVKEKQSIFSLRRKEMMHKISVTSEADTKPILYSAKHILIATGAQPKILEDNDLMEHAIVSDGIFELESLPKKIVIVGSGYVGIEFASILNALGSDVSLIVKKTTMLAEFDEKIVETLEKEMKRQGIQIYKETNGVKSIARNTNSLKTVTLHNDVIITDVDCILVAIGREPTVQALNLTDAGIKQKSSRHIVVDEYSETSSKGIYAVGDVCGNVQLTPMVRRHIFNSILQTAHIAFKLRIVFYKFRLSQPVDD